MKEIKLTKGYVTLVDDEDYDYLSNFKWHVACKKRKSITLYAQRCSRLNGKIKKHMLHNIIMKPPFGYQVDHIDRNGLNNIKSNLRICTVNENCRNVSKYNNKTSIYKGVSFVARRRRWLAKIKINKKVIEIGKFKNEMEAGMAYDFVAKILFGEFAYLNFNKTLQDIPQNKTYLNLRLNKIEKLIKVNNLQES